MENKIAALETYGSLSNDELLNIVGGKKKNPWYKPVVDFGEGFLDAF